MLNFMSIINSMIKQLKLKNYILISELTANFDRGLNIITGETGAGKSILINAIDLAFAPRISKEVIKSGADKAVIELVIDNTKHDLKMFFDEYGIDDLGTEIIISREISSNSIRSKINGTLINAEALQVLRSIFLDIHSQHQTYTFMQPKFHIKLLDSYAKNYYGTKLLEYSDLYSKYLDCLSALDLAKQSANATESQIDFLKFQINEIESAAIKSADEDEVLSNELAVLENAEKLKELTGAASWALNGDDGSILEALSKIKQNILKASSYDEKLSGINQSIIESYEILKELATDLNSYSQKLENDTERLNQIQERLFLLDKLKRKYGNTLENVLNEYSKMSQELASIEFSTKNIEEIETTLSKIKAELQTKAEEISEYRKQYAKVLSVQIQDKLAFLELPKSKFEISVKPKSLSSDGIDNVEFMITTNVSEDLKPLSKVASGGEISRVMLAIKSIFAQSDDIDTVIFDEIDTGISGKASQSVADEMVELAKFHQIILITHQPIIASKADKHFYVKKSQTDLTQIDVYVLTGENKIKALAELAAGEINDKSMEFAKALLAG